MDKEALRGFAKELVDYVQNNATNTENCVNFVTEELNKVWGD